MKRIIDKIISINKRFNTIVVSLSINFNFLDIQRKAKWLDRYYFIEGIHEDNCRDEWAQKTISDGLTSFYYVEPVNSIY